MTTRLRTTQRRRYLSVASVALAALLTVGGCASAEDTATTTGSGTGTSFSAISAATKGTESADAISTAQTRRS